MGWDLGHVPSKAGRLALWRRMKMRLDPNLQAMLAAIVLLVTIGALVFWIIGAAPGLD